MSDLARFEVGRSGLKLTATVTNRETLFDFLTSMGNQENLCLFLDTSNSLTLSRSAFISSFLAKKHIFRIAQFIYRDGFRVNSQFRSESGSRMLSSTKVRPTLNSLEQTFVIVTCDVVVI